MVIEFLDKPRSKEDDSYHYSEWSTQAAEAMCKEVRDFKIPGGKDGKVHTLGDLIDKTPKELISKVMLEEKLFSTWHGGRVALLGDGKTISFTDALWIYDFFIIDILILFPISNHHTS